MEIFINEKLYEFTDAPTLSEMLTFLCFKNTNGIAIAVNDSIVQKSMWPEYRLIEKDNITIIKATQGG